VSVQGKQFYGRFGGVYWLLKIQVCLDNLAYIKINEDIKYNLNKSYTCQVCILNCKSISRKMVYSFCSRSLMWWNLPYHLLMMFLWKVF